MGHDGLSLATSVDQEEREALMVAFAATAYERGYALTRLADVADRAGVTPAAVTRCWTGERDCLLETVATFTRRLFGHAAVAFMGADGDGPLALHAALSTILADAAGEPEMTYMSVVELPRLGAPAHARHARMIDLFGELLASGLASMDRRPPNPETLTLCLGGSVWETLRRHAAERRLHELHEALPGLSYVAVCTLFGGQEARRVTSLAGRGQTRASPASARQAPVGLPVGDPVEEAIQDA
jgi:AcrR family transcriptional regulator